MALIADDCHMNTDRADSWTKIATLIKQGRRRQRLTQAEAARQAGVGYTTWRSLEYGYRFGTGGAKVAPNVTPENLAAVARVAQADIREVFVMAGYDTSEIDALDLLPEPEVVRDTAGELVMVMQSWAGTDPERQEIVRVASEALAKPTNRSG